MMKRRRRPYRAARRRAPVAQKPVMPRRHSAARAAEPALSLNLLRVIVCGMIFVSLVTLKLVLPGGMAGVRGTLGSWLVRDADFVSAFSAIGRAVSGEGGVLDSLGDAYVAVFGEEEKAAEEVSGPADVPAGEETQNALAEERAEPDAAVLDTRDLPEHALAEQRVLGFGYASPLFGTITSPFGWREHPTSGRESFHYGADIGADEGTDIACFADGTVGVVGESTELGRYVTVHHENGFSTLYAHCSRVTVSSGQTIGRGDKLAEVGSTGNATGPHLHFEIHDGEDYLDPIYYLS